MNEVKDRIPLGNGKSRKLYAPHLSSSMTFPEFLTLLKNGELYIDLNANDTLTGDDIGVAQIGTKVNKALFASIATDIAKIPNMLTGTLTNTTAGTEETKTINVPIGTNKVRLNMVFLQNGSEMAVNVDVIIQENVSTMFGVSVGRFGETKAIAPSSSISAYWSDSRYATISNVSLNSAAGTLTFKLNFVGGYLATATYAVECYKQ